MKLRSLWNWPPVAVMHPLAAGLPGRWPRVRWCCFARLLAQAPDLIQSGIVVENSGKNSEAEKAGLGWEMCSCAGTRGAPRCLETPLVVPTETEQAPLEPFCLRAALVRERQVWFFGASRMGATARRILPALFWLCTKEGRTRRRR